MSHKQFPYIKRDKPSSSSSNIHSHQKKGKGEGDRQNGDMFFHDTYIEEGNPQIQEKVVKKEFDKKSQIKHVNESQVNMKLSGSEHKKLLTLQELQFSQIQKSDKKGKTNSTFRDIQNFLLICPSKSSENTEYNYCVHETISIKSNSQINKQQFSNVRVERGQKLSVRIMRSNSGFNYFLPQFDMSFVDDFKHILSCKKQMGTHSTYYFSTSKQKFQQQGFYIGKIRGSLLGDYYNIFGKQEKIIDGKKIKRVLCTSLFKFNTENEKLPKIYEIYILNEGVSFWDLEGIDEEKGLDSLINIGSNKQKILKFQTRKPYYCRSMGQFNLNFNGRVTKGSVKNFILEDTKSGRQVLMFGKNGDDMFNMDISYPLTPFIALGLMIPHFSVKIFCD